VMNCDEGQWQWLITGFWYIVMVQDRKKRNKPCGDNGSLVCVPRAAPYDNKWRRK
jgi:hypothetical protein